MDLNERLENVAVIGAAGKMGSGISLLLAEEMAFRKLENPEKTYALNLIDISHKSLEGLYHYIRNQVVKTAEKKIDYLREIFASRKDLVENHEMIAEYVHTVMANLRLNTEISSARSSHLVFEAVIENEDLKSEIFQQLKEVCSDTTYYFTNTSSIPIQTIQSANSLEGRVIGYHFYNPPAIQKLLEIITTQDTTSEVKDLATELAKRLRKTVIHSSDIAGFIGNGHFIRDGLYACSEVARLEKEHSAPEAMYMVNKVTQDLLVRPMGIFQLMDYVGIDVFDCIQNVMGKYLTNESFESSLIAQMIEKKVLGGQNSDGSQKDGFLKYEKGRPVGIYSLADDKYIMFAEDGWQEKVDGKLGNAPENWSPWKSLLKDRSKDEKLKAYFAALKDSDALGAKTAVAYLQKSKAIGEKLVADQVAEKAEDVNGVLMTGFFHLYGPINDYA